MANSDEFINSVEEELRHDKMRAFWRRWQFVIYAAIAVSGFAIATRGETVLLSPSAAGVTFHGALALAGLRHWFVANHWPRVKAWLCRTLNCERCLSCDKAPGGIDRRGK